MNKKREYAHEDMEALRKEIEVLRIRARQVDQDIRSGAISHEQWVSAAQELMERKKEILEILVDVDWYKQDLRAEIEKEKKFLHDGRIEMHNNAVESVFRHIAMGRRC